MTDVPISTCLLSAACPTGACMMISPESRGFLVTNIKAEEDTLKDAASSAGM